MRNVGKILKIAPKENFLNEINLYDKNIQFTVVENHLIKYLDIKIMHKATKINAIVY